METTGKSTTETKENKIDLSGVPDLLHIYEKIFRVGSLVEFILVPLEKIEPIEKIIDVVYNGNSGELKEHISIRHIFDKLADTRILINIAIDYLKESNDKLMQFEDFIDDHIRHKRDGGAIENFKKGSEL